MPLISLVPCPLCNDYLEAGALGLHVGLVHLGDVLLIPPPLSEVDEIVDLPPGPPPSSRGR